MSLSIRLSCETEQQLEQFCLMRKITKSGAVRLALDGLLRAVQATPHDLGADLFGTSSGSKRMAVDVARHTKRLLRKRFRGGTRVRTAGQLTCNATAIQDQTNVKVA